MQMRKYLLLILLVIAMPVRAENETVPTKFKNPIFNNIIYTDNYKFARDSRITPTYIKDLMTGFDEECSYITEDDKAIFLKCHYADKDFLKTTSYEMYFAKYKTIFKHLKEQSCNVWWCSFDIKYGVVDSMHHAAAMSSKVANCDDEEEYKSFDSNGKVFYVYCLSELKARGWDKYIPAKLPDEKK